MRERIGSALYWLCTAAAVIVLAFGVAGIIRFFISTIRAAHPPHSYASLASNIIGITSMIVLFTVIGALVPWLVGLACRRLLCADTPQRRKSTYTQISRVASGVRWLCFCWSVIFGLSAVVNGADAITAAFVMILFLQLGTIISNRYVAPSLRRWAHAT
jgi:hypothetical protein